MQKSLHNLYQILEQQTELIFNEQHARDELNSNRRYKA